MRKFLVHLPAIKHLAFISVIIFAFGYIIWGGTYSERGIIAYLKTREELEQTKKKLTNLQIESAELEQRACMLNPAKLDKDLVDELARRVLGLADPNEKIIVTKQNQ